MAMCSAGDCGARGSARTTCSKRRGSIAGSSGWRRSSLQFSKPAAGFPSFRSARCSPARPVRRAMASAPRRSANAASARWLRGRRGLARRYDLIRGSAHEFGHMVELEREAADAGGRRAHLHDEIADFRFRHLHAHHVPAVPALARVEAEDLAAPPRHEPVHLGGCLRRTDDLDLVDRLEQYRLALRQSIVDREPTGELKRHVGGIDRVIGAVDQLRRDVDHREAERTVLERVDDAFLHRRNVVAGHDAALDLLAEAEARSARQRLDVENDVTVLAVAARLLLVATALHDALLDGLAITHRRLVRDGGNAETIGQPLGGDAQLHLTLAP